MAPSSSSSQWTKVPVFAKCVGSRKGSPCLLRPCSTREEYEQGATRTTAFLVDARGRSGAREHVRACSAHVSVVMGIPSMMQSRSTADDATNFITLESFKRPKEAARVKRYRALVARSTLPPAWKLRSANRVNDFAVKSSITEDYRDKITVFTPDIYTDPKFDIQEVDYDDKTWEDGFGYKRPGTKKVYTESYMDDLLDEKIRRSVKSKESVPLVGRGTSGSGRSSRDTRE